MALAFIYLTVWSLLQDTVNQFKLNRAITIDQRTFNKTTNKTKLQQYKVSVILTRSNRLETVLKNWREPKLT